MQASILIVSKNRKEELERTLQILEKLINFSIHEVLVLLDGCDDRSELLKNKYNWVNWTILEKSIGASSARRVLYKNALGEIFIGFDDDAHPLQPNFIEITQTLFHENINLGIITFQEIKGVFQNDKEAIAQIALDKIEYFCNDFLGCGFAIKKEVYLATNGFPEWIDIYGEESCVAIEVMAKGFNILHTNKIAVNHRVNKEERKNSGANYFRFGKQLKNTTFYYLVYYRFPAYKIARLFWHNFNKYALMDTTYFKIYFKAMGIILISFPKLMRYRKPINSSVIRKIKGLPSPKF